MKRLTWVILICLQLGAILNIAVAWACALWSPISQPTILDNYSEIRALVRGLPVNQHVVTSRGLGFGVVRFTSSWHVPGEPNAIWHIQSGWPCVALSGQISVDREIAGALDIPRWLAGKVDTPARRFLPITPHATGFAINSVLWTIVLAMLTLGPGWLRHHHRKRSGCCQACGYDLSGTAHDRCPECGVQIHSVRVTVSSNSLDIPLSSDR